MQGGAEKKRGEKKKKKLIFREEKSLASPYLGAEQRAKDCRMPERKIERVFQQGFPNYNPHQAVCPD